MQMGMQQHNLESCRDRGRLVLQDLVDRLHNLRGQSANHLNRPHVLVHLVGVTGARDSGTDVGVLEDPGQRQLAQRDT